MKFILPLATVIAVVMIAIFFFAPKGAKPLEQSPFNDFIEVENLNANQKIVSPLAIEGKARGNWFFEASFPIELTDESGKRLAIAVAQADGEWMTTDFVPFRATLEFKKPDADRGWIIFKKDNPSGLPENDAEVKIPIKF